ncbi:hypothetical protein ACIQYF_21860 [Pseudomonas sp. NPDC096917]|uniref:hypothetical protein n=1 Tax=Pseudomonas sp. NPDC096917 TaxID=3364483 RepID=UPI00383AF650
MKRTALAGLFVCAAMLASPVFAAETNPAPNDLCSININKIQTYLDSSTKATSENTSDNLNDALAKAKDAKAANNDKLCIEITSAELAKITRLNSGDNK